MAGGVELATAYVNIIPSMQGAQGQITEMITGEASSAGLDAGQQMGDNMGEGLNLAMVAKAAAIVTTVAGIAREAWETINDVASYGDTIDKQSQMLSISARAYQELSFAAERSGTSINSFARGIRTITNDMADIANGVSGASDKFDRLGISVYDASGQMLTTEDVLIDAIMALADMEDATQRNALANDIFGRSYTELLPLLNSGSAGVEDLFNRFNELNGVMSDDGVAASAEFQDAMTNLQTAVQGVRNDMIAETGLTGAFARLIDVGANWVAKDHPRLRDAFESLAGTVEGVAEGIEGISYAVDGLGDLADTLDYVLEPVRETGRTFRDQFLNDMDELVPGMGEIGRSAIEAFKGGFGAQMSFIGSAAGMASALARGDWTAYNTFAGQLGLQGVQTSLIQSGRLTGFGSEYGAMGSRSVTVRSRSSSTGRSTRLGH